MTPGWVVAIVVYFVGVLGSLVFVVRRILSRWWQYQEGMALLLQHLMLVGFGASAAVALFDRQDYQGRVIVTLVLMVGFSGSVWWLTWLQERARYRARRSRPRSPEPPETHPAADLDPDPLP